MRQSSKSFANQFGVSHKNIVTNPSSGLGLNPNLNIEDQYIQNLLKQVHFLNMEIKLIKQKQKQNKGMGIMGLLNKDQNPVVTHAVTSNAKYSQMKNQLSQKVNSAEVDYIRLDDQNFAVKAQRDFTEKASLKEQQKNIENKIYVDKSLGQAREKLNNQLKKLKQLREQYKRTSQIHERINNEYQEMKTKNTSKYLLKQISDNLQKQIFELREKHFQITQEKLKSNQGKLKLANQKFKQDPQYIKLVQEQQQLKEKLKRTDKQLFDLSYRVKQMEQLKKFCVRNKDVQAQLKKQAVQQSQRLKKKLADKKAQFDAKLKESKGSLDSNDDVRLAKGKLVRKQKQINDLKKKTQVSQNNYKRLRDQVKRLQNLLAQRKQKNKNAQQNLNKLKLVQNNSSQVLRQAQLEYQKVASDLNNAQISWRDARKRLQALQQQVAYLGAKEDYLNKEINVDEGIKQVKIEQLMTLMNSNSGLNETISSLMGKWQQIIKFTRQPPSSM